MTDRSYQPVLVTGATGYVGGRLVPRLLEEGRRVRAMGRSMDKLAARPWADHPLIERVQADVLDKESLARACRGCWAAYYLVHSMDPYHKDFETVDHQAAVNMAEAAAEAGLERMIYLGGLVPEGQKLSRHLASRQRVGDILRSGPVPVTILRAAMILGSGSASFEIMRYLLDRLPVMITPLGVNNRVQPISIRNVITYLAGCLDHDEVAGQNFDICGPEALTYRDLFQAYAQEAGLPRRIILPLPFLTPRLCSYLIHGITPVHAALARPLAEGLNNTVVCVDRRIQTIIPQDLMDIRRTIRRILVKTRQEIVETSWADAGPMVPPEWVQTGDEDYAGGAVISAAYRVTIQAPAVDVWDPIRRLGGVTGWYFANFLWHLRGRMDRMAGGVGWRRGRRHATDLVVGDFLDFWRVLEVKPARRLLLMAELKAPGEMVLDVRLKETAGPVTEVDMIVRFRPLGLWGLWYWYALLPFHVWLFKGLLGAVAKRLGRPVVEGPIRFKPELGPAAGSSS